MKKYIQLLKIYYIQFNINKIQKGCFKMIRIRNRSCYSKIQMELILNVNTYFLNHLFFFIVQPLNNQFLNRLKNYYPLKKEELNDDDDDDQ